MKLRKVFRFRLKPTACERKALEKTARARRYVWNWALEQRTVHYQNTAELSRRLTALKQQAETGWLREVDAQALQQALADLHRAFVNFFEKRARFPRFKSRKRDRRRFRIPQRVAVVEGRVYVPKVGHVRIRQSQSVAGSVKSATFSEDAAGQWHVSLVTEFSMPDTPAPPANPGAVVGVDLGLKDFVVLSDGERIAAPKFARRAERRMGRAQRELARRQKQSNRRLRSRRKLARLHQRIQNQRNDFLHKLTTRLIREHDGICIEDLSVKGLARTKLARSVLDAAFGEFRRQLEYKAVWNRKHVAVIDRWYPSSKTCHACGAVNDAITPVDRSWTCVCGLDHDRDLNAALNIRSEGLKLIPLAAGHAERLNARGPSVIGRRQSREQPLDTPHS